MTETIKPITRVLIPEHHRTRIGVDTLTITPKSADGFDHVVVVVEHKTKHTSLYPIKEVNAQNVARAIFQYMCTFGLHDEIITDPGVEYMNDTVAQLNAWLQLRHKVSLVDVHESNGVERTNQEVLRHLRALVNDLRIRNRWSNPEVLALIEFALNDRVNTETGHSAFELKFGTADVQHFRLPEVLPEGAAADAWLRELNKDLAAIRQASDEYQK